jgi:RHS repeat-associated protein
VAASNLTPASCPTTYPAGYSDRLASDATTYTYDVEGQRTAMTTPAPAGQSGSETTTYGYDGAGDLTTITAPPASAGGPNQVTKNVYDNAGNLASQTTGYGTSAASTVSYCYDPDGNETSVVMPDGNSGGVAPCETSSPWVVSPSANPTQAAYQTTASYNSADELVSTTSPASTAAPNGATTTYTYDPEGNQLTSTDPDGVMTTRTFTPSDRAASLSYSGSAAHSVTYGYDADGNQTSMTDATGSSSYTYDPFGELSSATNGAGQTVSYGYDANGDTTSITYPLPSSATWATTDSVSYGYDNADRLNSVTDFNGHQITIGDTADGLPDSVSLGSSGDTITTSYAPTDVPASISLKNANSTLQSFTYSDAQAGNILSETDTPPTSKTPAVYSYDAKGRVTSETPGTGTQMSYGFDPSGNLTTLPNGAAGTYNPASELTSSVLSGRTTSYTYNADGERLTAAQGSTPIASGTWNGAGQLTAYSNSNTGSVTSAVYDGDGLRASANLTPAGGSASTQQYLWDNNFQLLMDSVNAYIYTTGLAPAEQVNLATGAITYLSIDSLGSVRGAINSSGALTAATSYDAWGNPQTPGGLTSATPFGFAGAYTDPDGLIYLINRYYDPATGQFISVDPDVAQTLEPYAYAGDDPVVLSDPNGMMKVWWDYVTWQDECPLDYCGNLDFNYSFKMGDEIEVVVKEIEKGDVKAAVKDLLLSLLPLIGRWVGHDKAAIIVTAVSFAITTYMNIRTWIRIFKRIWLGKRDGKHSRQDGFAEVTHSNSWYETDSYTGTYPRGCPTAQDKCGPGKNEKTIWHPSDGPFQCNGGVPTDKNCS